jgi:hypothetical protein
MPATTYERLIFCQDIHSLPSLDQPQRARLGKHVWLGIKPLIAPFYPLKKVQSLEPEGFYTVLQYPDDLFPHIDKLIVGYYESRTVKKRRRVLAKTKPVPIYQSKKQ